MRVIVGMLLLLVSISLSADLYTELMKERIKSVPLSKAIRVGEGDKRLITFVNPDCPHCRKEWAHLKNHLKELTLYVFVIYFDSWGEKNKKKASYILCSRDKVKALDEVLSGKYDRKEIPSKSCPLVEEHLKVASKLEIQGVPYNIVLGDYKVFEGFSDNLLRHLGIDEGKAE